MLGRSEKEEFQTILQQISITDLYSLVDTITKKIIKPSTKKEAISAILEYTTSSQELLKRKKIKRELLLQYALEKKMKVSVNADKTSLIIEILKQWGTLVDYEKLDGMEDEFDNDNQASARSDRVHIENQTQINIQVHNHFHSQDVTANKDSQGHPNSTSKSPCDPTCLNSITGKSELQILGEKFVEWFYGIINSHNPSTQRPPEDFGPHHFWDDVVLFVNTPKNSQEMYHGPLPVAQCFLTYTKEEQLLFNANVSGDGLFVKSTPHGTVAIMVCGTVHRGNECLGLFQQMFGIIKDPRYNDNWKIKISKLEVNGTSVKRQACLPDNPEKELLAIMQG